MKDLLRMLVSGTLGMAVFGSLLFVPAGTFNYWQAWVFLAVIVTASWISSIYFLRTNRAALQRRKLATETRMAQKLIAAGIAALWAAMVVVSVLDHRFGWSAVPAAISLIGDVLVAVGIGLVVLVIVQNSHAAVTVRVEEGQQLVSTGLYGRVRHPMYTSNIFLLVGTPLALGSYWGLLFVVPGLLVFAVRIRDEEKLLSEELAGYREYMQRVRYRLVPGIW
ncbi:MULTISPECIES: isoprenylcysteine carboxylmethyltransferase family protein [unclassified Mycolicibacterium]|uniref:methyltransferase family protein n=1 Tax=unclassified Mycolicibacterium TaxID=2636767 RepID=UPI001F4BD08C|nr:isoprenylcysteine carboxylmethyltransferase family protein [Mycolicibacterium sp. YH-1]UNB53468.1 isoprenylcysteine carboxylmethyltransferase family protein [Mycolicibacterium sp. YH-1]